MNRPFDTRCAQLDDLLGVGRSFDMVSRELYIGGCRAKMWVVNGYAKDMLLERTVEKLQAVKTLEDIDGGSGYVTLDVELSGSYGSAEQFAQACRSMTDAVQQCRPQPDTLIFAWSPDNDPEESLGTGTLQQVERYTLELVGIAQLDWTADQMVKQTEVQYLLDEENEEET